MGKPLWLSQFVSVAGPREGSREGPDEGEPGARGLCGAVRARGPGPAACRVLDRWLVVINFGETGARTYCARVKRALGMLQGPYLPLKIHVCVRPCVFYRWPLEFGLRCAKYKKYIHIFSCDPVLVSLFRVVQHRAPPAGSSPSSGARSPPRGPRDELLAPKARAGPERPQERLQPKVRQGAGGCWGECWRECSGRFRTVAVGFRMSERVFGRVQIF